MPADTITGVDFVTVPTADLAASVAFYGDVLGLHRSVHMPERGFAEFETGNLTLSIIVPEKMGMEPYVTPNPIALQTAGVTFEGETFDTGVCHMAFFRDPHGNPLMLHHRYAPRTTE
jgi:predicted enzyme related to lactoylglutathione lyase